MDLIDWSNHLSQIVSRRFGDYKDLPVSTQDGTLYGMKQHILVLLVCNQEMPTDCPAIIECYIGSS